jgi:hypothetical protein
MMRYFSYIQPIFSDDDTGTLIGDEIITESEEQIRREYYPWWREQMIKKYGEEAFNRNWSFEECLNDWVVVHWAKEVRDADN